VRLNRQGDLTGNAVAKQCTTLQDIAADERLNAQAGHWRADRTRHVEGDWQPRDLDMHRIDILRIGRMGRRCDLNYVDHRKLKLLRQSLVHAARERSRIDKRDTAYGLRHGQALLHELRRDSLCDADCNLNPRAFLRKRASRSSSR
jgi:hypothetical protein